MSDIGIKKILSMREVTKLFNFKGRNASRKARLILANLEKAHDIKILFKGSTAYHYVDTIALMSILPQIFVPLPSINKIVSLPSKISKIENKIDKIEDRLEEIENKI